MKNIDLDICQVVSSSDCTGLIPSLPVSDMEIESYSDIIPIPECEVKGKREVKK